MNTVSAIVGPDKLFATMFLHFRDQFRSSRADVSTVQLISHLPREIYGDRQALGATLTGALLAMLDHRKRTVDWSNVRLSDVPTVMPKDSLHEFDEIIISQAARTGVGLLASGPVMMRVLHWERADYRKMRQWLRALDKAARVQQRQTSVPLDDPLLRDVKKSALRELRPAIQRLQKWFKEQRRYPSKERIVKAFLSEATNPSFGWLSDSHNLVLWTAFVRVHADDVVNRSPEAIFDQFAGFVTGHDSEYTRKQFSRAKQ